MANESDNLDQAALIEDAFREKAIAFIRQVETPPTDFDGKHCFECDDVIPEARLALGKFRCVPCQELEERGRKFSYSRRI